MVKTIIQSLKIVDSLSVGEILLSHGAYGNIQSARVNAQKQLNRLVSLGTIERGDGYYRTRDCRSEFGEHARLLTRALTDLLKIPTVHAHVHREITIPEIGLRPDAICLITKDNQGLCFILEVCNNETDLYLTQKVNAWKHWHRATEFLSQLFQFKIPHFEIAISGEAVLDGTISYQSILKEVKA